MYLLHQLGIPTPLSGHGRRCPGRDRGRVPSLAGPTPVPRRGSSQRSYFQELWGDIRARPLQRERRRIKRGDKGQRATREQPPAGVSIYIIHRNPTKSSRRSHIHADDRRRIEAPRWRETLASSGDTIPISEKLSMVSPELSTS